MSPGWTMPRSTERHSYVEKTCRLTCSETLSSSPAAPSAPGPSRARCAGARAEAIAPPRPHASAPLEAASIHMWLAVAGWRATRSETAQLSTRAAGVHAAIPGYVACNLKTGPLLVMHSTFECCLRRVAMPWQQSVRNERTFRIRKRGPAETRAPAPTPPQRRPRRTTETEHDRNTCTA